MTNVVSDLLGKRVTVKATDGDGDDKRWTDLMTGIVRGVAQSSDSHFDILLEVRRRFGGDTRATPQSPVLVDLPWHMGLTRTQYVPEHTLVTVSMATGTYQNTIAVVVHHDEEDANVR